MKTAIKGIYSIAILSDHKPAYFHNEHNLKEFVEELRKMNSSVNIESHYKESIPEFEELVKEKFLNQKPDLVVFYFSHEKYRSRIGTLDALVRGYQINAVNHNANSDDKTLVHQLKKALKI